METINFVYWLQGFFEISDAKKLDEKQVQIIKDHLNLVFNKVTPNRESFPNGSTLQGGSSTAPIDFDLLPKTYCNSSLSLGANSTLGIGVNDLENLNTRKIC